ncbi:MAG: hypothetical protein L3I91_02735 [Mycoplasma sp.]
MEKALDPLQIASIVLGFIGATIAAISFLPGVIKVFKTKDTRSLSLKMFLIFEFGCFVWLAVGILNLIWNLEKDQGWLAASAAGLSVIVSNVLVGILGAILIFFKTKHMLAAKRLKISEDEHYSKYIQKKKRSD